MESSSHGPGGGDDAKAAPLSQGRVEVPVETVAVEVQGGKPQQQKPVLKKPDKLAPCPRCDSLDTKFCYYNNYNVNQPRHFCKNCQRYWTAGGTLRNVPVGAGRRKNKHGSLQARHAAQEQQQVVRLPSCHIIRSSPSVPDQISPPLASSSSDPSSQDRAVSSSSLQAPPARRHFVPAEPQASISSERGGSRLRDAEHGASCEPEAEKEDCAEACTSSAPGYSSELDAAAPAAQEVQSTIHGPATTTTTTTATATATATATVQPVVAGVVRGVGILDASVWAAAPAPFGLFNGSWPFGYNVGWSGPPPGTNPVCPPGGTLVTCQPAVGGIAAWSAPPNGLWPGVCWGSTLIPGMPPGLVGSPWMTPGWGGAWSMPWGGDAAAAAAAAASASMQAAAAVPSPPSANGTGFPSSRLPIRPVLSKHPRDRLELERVESSLWVPKMVRLDDPGNIPRSSAWTAVGAETRLESVAPGSNFKAFLPVRDDTYTNNNKAASVTSGDNKKRVGSSS